MIKRVFANKPSFKSTEFQPGFNVIWADRTKESTKKDSRNGLGKSTLIEIIHFCLGASAQRGRGLLVDPLQEWEFSVVLELGGNDVTVTRSVASPHIVTVDGDTSLWPVQGQTEKGRLTYRIREWTPLLGHLMFGLPMNDGEKKYQPTFRGLISYFIRRGKDAFSTPFEHYRKQKEWDKQVDNAFLLGLAWEDAAEFQIMKDQKKGLGDFKKAVKAGVVKGLEGSVGDLEAQRVRLKTEVEHEASALASFRVHLQYAEIQNQANELTTRIHELVNANTMEAKAVQLYESSLEEEQAPADDSIERLYQEAGVALPDLTLRRLQDVREFHRTIVQNRRSFLTLEIERLKQSIERRSRHIRDLTNERASILDILRTHGALEEYTLLQARHAETISRLKSIASMIDNLKGFESGLSEFKVAQQELQKKARRDYDERSAIRERAIALFNDYSEHLYDAPGKLIINIGPTGFQFDVEIERSGSSGIDNMKIFCYDLMLARLWGDRSLSPKLCIHDSTIFDGVDERQRSLALELAASESQRYGYQYLCMLNTDNIPWPEFSKDFDLRKYVRLTLTDKSVDGCLLGIRF